MTRNFSTAAAGRPSAAHRSRRPARSPVAAGGGAAVARWSTRIAEEVAVEVEAIARLKGLSVNALVMVALDRLLKEHGRLGSPNWRLFPDYLMRQGGSSRDKEPPIGGEFD